MDFSDDLLQFLGQYIVLCFMLLVDTNKDRSLDMVSCTLGGFVAEDHHGHNLITP